MTVVDRYQAQTESLAAGTVKRVALIYAAYKARQIVRERAVQLVAAAVNTSRAAATTLADAFVAGQVEQAAAVPVPAVGVPPVDDTERLVKAVDTILAAPSEQETETEPSGEPEPEMRLERLARSESLEAGHQGAAAAMQAQPLVAGWVRETDADPCQLCTWWYRGGYVWPAGKAFQSHPGCNCQPRVVLAESRTPPEPAETVEENDWFTFEIERDTRYE